MEYKTESEAKRIYEALNIPANCTDYKKLKTKEKVYNLFSYEIIEYLAVNGVSYDQINPILEHCLNIDIYKKCIHIRKKFKQQAREKGGAKCILCGNTENVEIHHIKKVSTHPHLKLRPYNTILLCSECHKQHHKKQGDF